MPRQKLYPDITKVLLRLPTDLHSSLRSRAVSEGRSINSLIVGLLGGVAESGRKRPVASREAPGSAGSNPASTAGEVAERSMASVSKTDEGDTSGGSNPSLSAGVKLCACGHTPGLHQNESGRCKARGCGCRWWRESGDAQIQAL
jgi:hypothetical protein